MSTSAMADAGFTYKHGTYLIGELVVVYNRFLGRVSQITERGIWVRPLIEKMPETGSPRSERQYHHACYDPANVRPAKGYE